MCYRTLFVAFLFCHTPAWSEGAAAPEGWWAVGEQPPAYVVRVDQVTAFSGFSSAVIASEDAGMGQFGGLGQAVSAAPYRGQKVRYTGYLKTDAVNGYGGLWMRVDAIDGRVLALDNMSARPITGTQDWARFEVVLDVPDEAGRLVIGALLAGTGRVWLDDAALELAEPTSPATGSTATEVIYHSRPVEALPTAPRNADFEQ